MLEGPIGPAVDVEEMSSKVRQTSKSTLELKYIGRLTHW